MTTTTTPRRDLTNSEVVPVVVVALAAAAWLVLLWPAAHAHGSTGAGWSPITGWALMITAMMLPPALPLLQTVHRLVARRRARTGLVAAGAAAFLAVWLLAASARLTNSPGSDTADAHRPDSGRRMPRCPDAQLDTGHRAPTPDSGHPDAGRWSRGASHAWTLDAHTGHWTPDAAEDRTG